MRRQRPLRLEALETRLTPTYNVSIESFTTTTGFDVQTTATQVTFSANATGATLSIDDILAALTEGKDVQIDTGVGGGENGDVQWLDNLDFNAITGARSLSLNAAGTLSVFGSISDSNAFLSPDVLSFQFESGGDMNLSGFFASLSGLTANAGTSVLTLGTLSAMKDTADLTAGTIRLNSNLSFDTGDLFLRGNVELNNGLGSVDINLGGFIPQNRGNLTIEGSLDSLFGDGLTVSAQMATFGGVIGTISPLTSLTVTGATTFEAPANALVLDGVNSSATFNGNVTFNSDFTLTLADAADVVTFSGLTDVGSHSFSTNGVVSVVGGANDAVLAIAGDLSAASVLIGSGGVLAPGGRDSAPVTLAITGDVTIAAQGELHIDMGSAASDRVDIAGELTLEPGSRLDGSGSPGAGPRVIVSSTTRTGEFSNAETGGAVVLGMDAFTATYSTTEISVDRTADGPATVVGATEDGTLYTVRLLGPTTAKLVVVDNGTGIIDVVVRNAAATSSLSITVTPNGGLGEVQLGALRVNGPLVALTAPMVDFAGEAIITGLLGSATVRDMLNGSSLKAGGLATQTTTLIKSASIRNVEVGSRIGTLDTQSVGDFFGPSQIAAAGITTLKVTGNMQGNLRLSPPTTTATALGTATIGNLFNSTWDIRGKIGSVTVSRGIQTTTIGTSESSFAHENEMGDIGTFRALGNVGNLTINSVGRITTLAVGELFSGSIRARTIGALSTVANAAAGIQGGWFNTNLRLEGGTTSTLALGSASFAGGLGGLGAGSVWDIQGRIGSLTALQGMVGLTVGTAPGSGASFADQLGGIASIRVVGELGQTTLRSVGRIGSLTASNVRDLTLRAATLGTMTVGTAMVPGILDDSQITLTGSFGTASNALDTLVVNGPVRFSRFDILAGNVGSVTVGRFASSQMYLGYTPDSAFETLGTFTSTPRTLTRFVTTQAYRTNLPQTLAFRDSEIVAHRFGTIRLSGVLTDNLGDTFGVRVNGAANRGSVRVAAPTPTFTPTADLLPNVTFGDFRFLAS